MGTLVGGGEKHWKFDQVFQYTLKNANRVFVDTDLKINPWIFPALALIGILMSRWRWFILSWSFLVISFFHKFITNIRILFEQFYYCLDFGCGLDFEKNTESSNVCNSGNFCNSQFFSNVKF